MPLKSGRVRSGLRQVSRGVNAIPDSAVSQYNAQELSGVSDGDAISTWSDETGNGNDASGSATYSSSDINGYPALDFDEVDDKFRAQFASNVSQRVVIFAVTQTDTTTSSDIHGVVSPYSNRSMFGEPAGNGNNDFVQDAGSNGTSGGGAVNTNPSLLTAIFDGANTEIRQNGTTVLGPQDLGSSSWDGVTIGYVQFIGGDNWYDGSIGFVEMHDGNPSNGLSTREQEIADTWGITL